MNRTDLKNTITAVVLCVLVIVGWSYFFGPKPQPPRPAQPPAAAAPQAPAAAAAQAPSAVAPGAAEGAVAPAAGSAPAAPAEEKIVGDPQFPPLTVKTPHVEILLSPRGGRVLQWRLLDYAVAPADPSKGHIDLVSPEARALDRHPLTLATGDAALDKLVNTAPCVVEDGPAPADEARARKFPGAARKIVFRWADQGYKLVKTLYVAEDDTYLARVEWSLLKDGRALTGAALSWGPSLGAKPEEGGTSKRYAYRGYVKYPEGTKVRDMIPEKSGDMSWPGGASPRWIALVDQYFALALVPDQGGAAAVRGFGAEKERTLGLTATAAGVTFFAGPKSDKLLARIDRTLGVDLAQLVPWGMWGFLARPLYFALGWFDGLLGNWGLAIVVVTVIIRLLFLPLMHSSMVKMRRAQAQMSKLQPKIHKIREKYKGKRDVESRRKVNEEMMELYRREGINPMAQLTGCLPLLLQMPVLFAMYTVLTVATELRGAPFFGWVRDLSAMDPYYITPIVMGVTMLVQQLMSTTKTEDPQQRSQQRMMLVMPVVFTWMFLWVPSGLALYWLVNNIVSIGQQALVNRHAVETAPARG